MKLRWELGALLTVRCFSNAQATTSYYGCFSSFISDGMCDSSNNNAGCDYDGGDCCSCDCFDDTYDCGVAGFICIDPTSSCTYHHYYDDDYNDYSDDFYVSSDDHSDHEDHDDDGDGCDSLFDGDGWCDSWNNNSECDYDGGDCCSCDCIDDNYECGVNGFNCIDPTSSCTYHHYYDDDESDDLTPAPTPPPAAAPTGDCYSPFVADGDCDTSNNISDCDYDGGDCCSCDCIDDNYECGASGFTCIDPSSSCTYHHYYDDDGSDGCYSSLIGDGYCDTSNNISDCDYDGGDCCSCDCIDGIYECGYVGFNCIDPTSSCTYHHYYDDDGSDDPTLGPTPQPSTEETPEPTPQPTADSTPRSIPEVSPEPTAPNECLSEGDGLCDEANNNAECNWDGGDCCECDCSEPLSSGDRSVEFCGGNGYNCINPDSSCKEGDDSTLGDDGAPMGVIVGGAVGGAVFLAGVAALVCLLATGRLKCGKCCSSSTSPAVPAAPASGGSASAAVTGFRGPAASSSATAAAPAASASDPPAAAGGSVQDPMSTEREVPVARATPPPAYGESDPPHKE